MDSATSTWLQPERYAAEGRAPARNVLITGGCGYVGAHVAVDLLQHGHSVALLDDLSNSRLSVVDVVAALAGRSPAFHRVDLLDVAALRKVFSIHAFDTVIHCAGLKSVGESVAAPLRYYRVNVEGALNLLQVMAQTRVNRILFSSSATVYGLPSCLPVDESCSTGPVNPYGWSKRMVEQMISDHCSADPARHAVALRYFNPAGAHESGALGECPHGVPNNLFPLIGEVARGSRACLKVFGTDYGTLDGTCVRDYIHVMDLARAHRMAVEAMPCGFMAANLGTGRGYSVLEVVDAYRQSSGAPVELHMAPRRPGDVEALCADPALAWRTWGWKAERGLPEMCRDAWRWENRNPDAAVRRPTSAPSAWPVRPTRPCETPSP